MKPLQNRERKNIDNQQKTYLSLMNRFNSLINVQHFNVKDLTPEIKRETKVHFATIWNMCDIAKTFFKINKDKLI